MSGGTALINYPISDRVDFTASKSVVRMPTAKEMEIDYQNYLTNQPHELEVIQRMSEAYRSLNK